LEVVDFAFDVVGFAVVGFVVVGGGAAIAGTVAAAATVGVALTLGVADALRPGVAVDVVANASAWRSEPTNCASIEKPPQHDNARTAGTTNQSHFGTGFPAPFLPPPKDPFMMLTPAYLS